MEPKRNRYNKTTAEQKRKNGNGMSKAPEKNSKSKPSGDNNQNADSSREIVRDDNGDRVLIEESMTDRWIDNRRPPRTKSNKDLTKKAINEWNEKLSAAKDGTTPKFKREKPYERQAKRDAQALIDYADKYGMSSSGDRRSFDYYNNDNGVEIKDLINAQANQITMIERQFAAIKKEKRSVPLQAVGSNLTGTIANTLHMLCDPGHAAIVPFPGLDPESQIKTNFTPATSLTLNNGLARVIITPFGKFQVYISQDAPITIDPNVGKYKSPTVVLVFGDNQSADATTVFDQGQQGTQGLYCYNAFAQTQLNFPLDLHNTFVIDFPEELVGGVANLVFQNDGAHAVNITQPGLQYINVYGGPAPNNDAEFYTCTTIGDQLNSIRFIPPQTQTIGTVCTVPMVGYHTGNGAVSPFVIALSQDNYYAVTAPQLETIWSGNRLNRQGRFIAMSALICSDASAIANNGFIYGTSLPQRLSVPLGTSFPNWISQQTRWYYKGRLATGMYQIYVPTTLEEQVFDPLVSSPWFGNLQYNMVFMIDNSFSLNGAQLPDKTQAHVVLEAVYSTVGLNDIIDAKQSHPDPGWPMALALLRKYYSPCCNPDHKDEIMKWLKNVFNELISAGKDIITSPVTHEILKKAASTALPIAMSLI